jgi:hypothetical protein
MMVGREGVKKEEGPMTKPTDLKVNPPIEQKVETPSEDLRPEDFYYEGPYLVFTAAYHLKRGYCCNSECRHCPYK